MTKVTLKGTGAIPAYFLRNCSGLKTVALEGSFTAIGKNAFEGCAGLESLSIPDTVTTIGNNAFTGCTGLSQIQLPLSVAQSAEGLGLMITPEVVFPADFFAGYELPQGIETIEDSAFEGAAWEMVALPATCQTVGSRAFANNRALKYLYVPDSVQTIAGDAFVGCDQLYLVGSGNTVKTYADKYLDGRCYLQH